MWYIQLVLCFKELIKLAWNKLLLLRHYTDTFLLFSQRQVQFSRHAIFHKYNSHIWHELTVLPINKLSFGNVLFICGSFSCTLSSSRLYGVHWWDDQWTLNRKGYGIMWWPNLKYHFSICLLGLKKIVKNLSHNNQSWGSDLNLGLPEYEALVMPT